MQIEKTIPAPPPVLGGGARKYPFRDMQVGDSVVCEAGPSGSSNGSRAYMAARQFAHRYGVKFAARKIEDRPGFIRIWRVA